MKIYFFISINNTAFGTFHKKKIFQTKKITEKNHQRQGQNTVRIYMHKLWSIDQIIVKPIHYTNIPMDHELTFDIV